jgi:hypothetical protein
MPSHIIFVLLEYNSGYRVEEGQNKKKNWGASGEKLVLVY